MTPEIRTRQSSAIALCVAAVLAIAISAFAGSKLEDLLGSAGAATALLALWCVLGCVTAIAAVVDAYVRPEGEQLNLVTTIAATVFAILGVALISGVVAGTANLSKDEPAEEQSR